MKKNNRFTGIITLTVVVVLSIVIIIGINFLAKYDIQDTTTNQTVVKDTSAIDISGYETSSDILIQSASNILEDDGSTSGYIVTVVTTGLESDIIMDVTFDKTGDKVTSLSILEQNETKDYGAKITEDSFLSQFKGIAAPVYITDLVKPVDTSTTVENTTTEDASIDASTSAEVTSAAWVDGTYVAESEVNDQQGFINTVSITIKDGKIIEIIWDAYNQAGEYKSLLSADGAFVMTKNGLTWQEQAIALADYIIEKQSLTGLTIDENFKTDSISGVSISINEFINLVESCFAQASPTVSLEEEASVDVTPTQAPSVDEASTLESSNVVGTKIDGVTGATFTSTAVVNGINAAQTFVKDFVLGKQ